MNLEKSKTNNLHFLHVLHGEIKECTNLRTKVCSTPPINKLAQEQLLTRLHDFLLSA